MASNSAPENNQTSSGNSVVLSSSPSSQSVTINVIVPPEALQSAAASLVLGTALAASVTCPDSASELAGEEDLDAFCGEERSAEESDAGSLVDFIVNDGEAIEKAPEPSEAEQPESVRQAKRKREFKHDDLSGICSANILEPNAKRARRSVVRLQEESRQYARMMLADIPPEELDAAINGSLTDEEDPEVLAERDKTADPDWHEEQEPETAELDADSFIDDGDADYSFDGDDDGDYSADGIDGEDEEFGGNDDDE